MFNEGVVREGEECMEPQGVRYGERVLKGARRGQ